MYVITVSSASNTGMYSLHNKDKHTLCTCTHAYIHLSDELITHICMYRAHYQKC